MKRAMPQYKEVERQQHNPNHVWRDQMCKNGRWKSYLPSGYDVTSALFSKLHWRPRGRKKARKKGKEDEGEEKEMTEGKIAGGKRTEEMVLERRNREAGGSGRNTCVRRKFPRSGGSSCVLPFPLHLLSCTLIPLGRKEVPKT